MPCFAGLSDIDPSKNTIIFVGDTQRTSCWEFWRERNDLERRLVADEIASLEPAMLIHLGDLTAWGAAAAHWQEFDVIHVGLLEKRIPVFPILGNHDLFGSKKRASINYFSRFPCLENRRWYSFKWKNIAFVMVDSNFSALSPDQVGDQAMWYVAELARYNADPETGHIIVCCHEPPYTSSRVVSGNKKTESHFARPFMKTGKGIFFFSGHSHAYECFEKTGKYFIVSGGGGGPRHRVTTAPGEQKQKGLLHSHELSFFHFCRLSSLDRGLLLEVLSLNSYGCFSVADSLEIT